VKSTLVRAVPVDRPKRAAARSLHCMRAPNVSTRGPSETPARGGRHPGSESLLIGGGGPSDFVRHLRSNTTE
jgi:hypothetical protein